MTLEEFLHRHGNRYSREPVLYHIDPVNFYWMATARPMMKKVTVAEWAQRRTDDPFWRDLLTVLACAKMGV